MKSLGAVGGLLKYEHGVFSLPGSDLLTLFSWLMIGITYLRFCKRFIGCSD